ncbi:MAG: metallophosphoesterase [Cyanobacteria bacterium P01_C01_bin.89]
MLSLLTDPFLQLPTAFTVNVVWFTEWQGDCHWVDYGDGLKQQVSASSQQVILQEDGRSHWHGAPSFQLGKAVTVIDRPVWRHEAVVVGLKTGDALPYQVVSVPTSQESVDDRPVKSGTFFLSPLPLPQQNLKILLTSDHQMMPMVPQTLHHAAQLFEKFDAVFYAGDMVNVPDRCSEWFDDRRGRSFFPCFQGRAIAQKPSENQSSFEIDPTIDRIISDEVNTQHAGGKILQNTPIFTCIGNHEVMATTGGSDGLSGQFPIPKSIKTENPKDQIWIDDELSKLESKLLETGDRPFSTNTYESIFTLPKDSPGGKRYYATTFGSVRLISLEATNVWRWYHMNDDTKGRYQERVKDFNNPQEWGGGQFIFEPIKQGSIQYQWLEEQLQHPDFKRAKYRVVMFHHPPHSLGNNIVPPYTDPQQEIQRDNNEEITSIRYHYDRDKDYLIRDVMPLLEQAGVQLVYYGHCHLWNRFEQTTDWGTMHFLESSHAGNTHGAAWGDIHRKIPDKLKGDRNYIAVGNPNGLTPIVPNISPLLDSKTKEPLPYIAHDKVGVFSVFDTGSGEISSYRYESGKSPVKFDVFKLTSSTE